MILRLFIKVCSARTRVRYYKLGEGGFKLDIEKKNSFSWWGWWGTGIGCPEKLRMPHHWSVQNQVLSNFVEQKMSLSMAERLDLLIFKSPKSFCDSIIKKKTKNPNHNTGNWSQLDPPLDEEAVPGRRQQSWRALPDNINNEENMIPVLVFGREIITQNLLCCHRPLCGIHPSLANCPK